MRTKNFLKVGDLVKFKKFKRDIETGYHTELTAGDVGIVIEDETIDKNPKVRFFNGKVSDYIWHENIIKIRKKK